MPCRLTYVLNPSWFISAVCWAHHIIRWVSCCGVSYYEIEGSIVAHTSAWFINAHKKNSFSCKSSNISHFSTILETLSEGIWNSLSSSSTAIKTENEMLRSAVRLQMGVEREWEVASNTTWTYVRFHWDLLALSRSAEGSTIHFFSHVDWAAVGYKKEQQQPTSWSRLSTFRRNGKFHNYSKVSLWAEMIQAIIKLLRWKLSEKRTTMVKL